MRHLFVIDPRHFRRENELDVFMMNITGLLDKKGEEFRIHVSRHPRDAIAVARNFANERGDVLRVYAIGGDDLLFDCLGGIADLRNVQLANLAAGFSNNYLRAFGDRNLHRFQNIEKLIYGTCVRTDIFHCGSNYAINGCAIGLESGAITRTARLNGFLKRHGLGALLPLSLTFGLALSLLRRKSYLRDYKITVDGETLDGRYASIRVTNTGRHYINKTIVPDASPDDGLADVLIMRHASLLRGIAAFVPVLGGKWTRYRKVFIRRRAAEITVSSDSPMYISLDGETFSDTKIKISVLPSAVKFVTADGVRFENSRLDHAGDAP